jgi:two-component system chemotaxis response regulator CheY
MKILIVDDDRTSLLVLKRQLEKWDNEVISAVSAAEGLRLLEDDQQINLLITDWVMPEMTGLELCREARKLERPRFLPIMMLTALTDTQDLVQALNAGADAFLSKPINPMQLKAEIRVTERVLDLEVRLEAQIRQLEEAHVKIKAMAETDELTQLPNRRTVLQRLDEEISRAERYGHPLSIVLLDIDHFKDVNDTYGHPAGDTVLRQTAKKLSGAIRDTDLLGRYGGEEFLAVLAQTDLPGARKLAERIRTEIESHVFDLGNGTNLRKTVSLGASTWNHGSDSADELIARADAALYLAKEGGRNRVVMAEERT